MRDYTLIELNRIEQNTIKLDRMDKANWDRSCWNRVHKDKLEMEIELHDDKTRYSWTDQNINGLNRTGHSQQKRIESDWMNSCGGLGGCSPARSAWKATLGVCSGSLWRFPGYCSLLLVKVSGIPERESFSITCLWIMGNYWVFCLRPFPLHPCPSPPCDVSNLIYNDVHFKNIIYMKCGL